MIHTYIHAGSGWAWRGCVLRATDEAVEFEFQKVEHAGIPRSLSDAYRHTIRTVTSKIEGKLSILTMVSCME